MRHTSTLALLLCMAAIARDHKLPAGEAANEAISIAATVFDAEQLKQSVGAGFEEDYIVLEVTLRPKTASPYEVKLDDFILRSEMSADHSGPLLAGQIAGSGMLIVRTDDPDSGKRRGGLTAGIGGGMIGSANGSTGETRSAEMKDDTPAGTQLDVLKKKILTEKPVTAPVTGLLFFPMNVKEKAKYLNLQCKTPAGILRIRFK